VKIEGPRACCELLPGPGCWGGCLDCRGQGKRGMMMVMMMVVVVVVVAGRHNRASWCCCLWLLLLLMLLLLLLLLLLHGSLNPGSVVAGEEPVAQQPSTI